MLRVTRSNYIKLYETCKDMGEAAFVGLTKSEVAERLKQVTKIDCNDTTVNDLWKDLEFSTFRRGKGDLKKRVEELEQMVIKLNQEVAMLHSKINIHTTKF